MKMRIFKAGHIPQPHSAIFPKVIIKGDRKIVFSTFEGTLLSCLNPASKISKMNIKWKDINLLESIQRKTTKTIRGMEHSPVRKG